jgi:hypothetical protein
VISIGVWSFQVEFDFDVALGPMCRQSRSHPFLMSANSNNVFLRVVTSGWRTLTERCHHHPKSWTNVYKCSNLNSNWHLIAQLFELIFLNFIINIWIHWTIFVIFTCLSVTTKECKHAALK